MKTIEVQKNNKDNKSYITGTEIAERIEKIKLEEMTTKKFIFNILFKKTKLKKK